MPELRPIRLLLAASLISAPTSIAVAGEADTFRESFAGGKAELRWVAHPMSGDVAVQGVKDDAAPDGDGGIGVLRHAGGSLPTVSYAETERAEGSFEIEAEVHCPLEGDGRDGTLTGLAFYVLGATGEDDADAGGLYRFVCDYRLGPAAFSLAYVGANIARQPLELERWPVIEQEAAADAGDPWRHVRIVADQGLLTFHLDGTRLNRRPIPAERVITDIASVDAGYAGIYAGHIGQESTATARIDGFVYRVR